MSRPRRGAQRRVLVRTTGLRAFREALVDRALDGRPLDVRRRAIILPTRASAQVLRQTIERAMTARDTTAIVLPDLLTRDEWIRRLHAAVPGAPPLLSRTTRELLLARAGRDAAARTRMPGAPFQLRPGLVSELLRFYDELRLRQRTVRRMARAIFDELRVERGTDRGSEGLIHQASFMGFAFLGYDRGRGRERRPRRARASTAAAHDAAVAAVRPRRRRRRRSTLRPARVVAGGFRSARPVARLRAARRRDDGRDARRGTSRAAGRRTARHRRGAQDGRGASSRAHQSAE